MAKLPDIIFYKFYSYYRVFSFKWIMDLFADSGQETNSTSTAEQVKIANAKIFLLAIAKKK